jgi:hypothetical protein
MDGSGYPRQLTARRDEPAGAHDGDRRHLRGADRRRPPYKKGKTLSEATAIMARMQQEQHIDGELFDPFPALGRVSRLRARFMQPEQIDAVDVDRLLEASVPAGLRALKTGHDLPLTREFSLGMTIDAVGLRLPDASIAIALVLAANDLDSATTPGCQDFLQMHSHDQPLCQNT